MFLCFDQLLTGFGQLGLQFRTEDDLLVEAGNIVLMVLWITVTSPFGNIYEEKIYSCLFSIYLAVLTLFIIVLVATDAITTTTTTIALLTTPLDFSKLELFANTPVLLFTPPHGVSLAESMVQSTLDRDVVEKEGQCTT